jgi:hypothetical protein
MKLYSRLFSILFALSLLVPTGCSDDDVIEQQPTNGLVAVAGPDRSIEVNGQIELDGSASHDKNQRPFTYSWSLKIKPQGSTALITSANEVKSTFSPDVAGVYVIQLTVSQNSWSASDEVILTVTSQAPGGPTTVILSEDINSDLILNDIFVENDQPDYIVTADIAVRGNLMIMPGVVIAFAQHKGLQVMAGSLAAQGTADQRITFKGMNDTPGYWKGLVLFTSNPANELAHVTIRDAGSIVFPETGIRSALTLAGSAISASTTKITNSVFSGSGGYGISVQGASYLSNFADNTFSGNQFSAMYVPARILHQVTSLQFGDNNGFNGVETGGLVPAGIDVTWKNPGNTPFFVSSNITIKGNVSVEKGASFFMGNNTAIATSDNGTLDATGTQDERIVFTSANAGVRWNGIYFNSPGPNNKMIYTLVANAGLDKIGPQEQHGNIVVGENGQLIVRYSHLKNGLGFGINAFAADRINADVVQVNTFENLSKGYVFPSALYYPDRPALTGAWVDWWSFNQNIASVSTNFYNRETGSWYNGAPTPWTMNTNEGIGIHIDEHGRFIWSAAEHSPWTGCEAYSAEYMEGTVVVHNEKVIFYQEYWRSKFVNSCDPAQNVEMEVAPDEVHLPYEITKMYNMLTGEGYWQLKFTNPDGSTFAYYRR